MFRAAVPGQREWPQPERLRLRTGPVFVSLGLIIFHPEDVVRSVEGDQHHARAFRLAGELVLRFAGHGGKSAWTERARRHPVHFRPDVSLYDDELFLGGVIVPRDQTIRYSFQDDGGRAFGGVAGFDRREQALDFVIGVEFEFGQGTNDAAVFGLRLRKARDPEQQDREPRSMRM